MDTSPAHAPSWRVLVMLCRRRLTRTATARLGWGLALVATTISIVLMAGLAQGAVLEDVVLRGVRWVIWLGLVPLGMVVANDPVERDREEGIELLVVMHGASERRLRLARTFAAILETALRIALPAIVLCIASLGFGARPLHALEQAAWLVCFALGAGALLGTLASACGHIGRQRGRLLLFAVLILPWGAADRLTTVPLSIPGLMEAGLSHMAAAAHHGVLHDDSGGMVTR